MSAARSLRALLVLVVLALVGCDRAARMDLSPEQGLRTEVPFEVSAYLEGLDFPGELAFAPDGRLFFTELRNGTVRVVESGRLLPDLFASVSVVRLPTYSEHGLLGMALDPAFARNGYVYLFYSEPDRFGLPRRQRVVRFTDRNGAGVDMKVVLDDLPVGARCCHNGGRLAFGKDGKLYVSIGDTENGELSQDLDSLAGKILRINPDGTIPADNPFPGSPVFALGLRNPFGLAVRPETGQIYATENGPSGHDEINLIRPGGNYGWPRVTGTQDDGRFTDPLWESGEEHLAPTGAAFYTGQELPQFAGDLFFCSWNRGALMRARLVGPSGEGILDVEEVAPGCQTEVTMGPDGALYFAGQDGIFRLHPR